MAYHLALSPELSTMHPVFHVSMLQKYLLDPSHVLALHTIQLDEDLTNEEEAIVNEAMFERNSSNESNMEKPLGRGSNLRSRRGNASKVASFVYL